MAYGKMRRWTVLFVAGGVEKELSGTSG